MEENIYILHKNDRNKFIEEFNSFLDKYPEGFLMVISEEDQCSDEKGMAEFLAQRLKENPEAVLATPKKLFQIPDRITGVMLNLGIISKHEGLRMNGSLTYNYEADFLLRLMRAHPFLIQQKAEEIYYSQEEAGDGNYKKFHGIYDKAWYLDDIERFLLPKLEEEKPSFLFQYYVMYNLTCRLEANQNNNNRHVLSEDETDYYMGLIHEVLQYIDDQIIMNAHRYPVYKRDYQFCRMLLRIKYNKTPGLIPDSQFINLDSNIDANAAGIEEDQDIIYSPYHHTQGYGNNQLYITVANVPVHSTYSLRCNIQLMDIMDSSGKRVKNWKNYKYKDNETYTLEIDGSFPDIYDKDIIKYYFEYKGKRYEPQFCQRYSLTKFFARSAYKRYPFHVSIPLLEGNNVEDVKTGRDILTCHIEYKGISYPLLFEFKSHTSRLSAFPVNNYWHVGKWILRAVHDSRTASYKEKEASIVTGICIENYNWFKMAGWELKTGWELLTSPGLRMHHLRFLLLRMAWVITRPYFRSHRTWMFFDKIYKAGDSAEYMYKYAVDLKRNKQIPLNLENNRAIVKKEDMPDRLYYLVDKACPDYQRLCNEGYKVLRRGSFLHRLVFLNADVMLVTNSTVFAFNDYYLENSRYIRGITDFTVVCLQHGLSVQKIGLAQQRLRDNTRLYFLASKYEMANLQHPVYDYVGYNALKLSGIPRYDGLVDKSQNNNPENNPKQIMISPTWRMQSASFVTRNEGVERDYNPEFKETPYYKVYNSLINDERLIDAARRHNYKIKYVLHPIVSPQAEDFDKNPYVDIIPSTGDMSYEDMFCQSSLMITDYSGIQFDFAYMRKPIIYYHPTELEAHYEEGVYRYDTMAFGEIVRRKDELINLIISYMEEGCNMKELYRMRADDFFQFDDRENCSRVYKEILLNQN
ncbi:MAG: CDP-glycerol glycerophosphotransferase family protein [Eubacterium sp.]|nr:CDP-glycerol glycerophosphotransferase family protein [Eubacterium sp.]